MEGAKKVAGPAMIAGAVVLLAIILYAIYRFTLAPPPSHVSADNRPEYAKQAAEKGIAGGVRPSYGQGAGYGGGPRGGPR